MSRSNALLAVIVLSATGLTAGLAIDAGAPVAPAIAPASRFVPKSFRFPSPTGEAPAVREEAAPIGLTASDGTGLALVALEVNGLLQPPLAFTEVRMTFENPRDQVIEGRFRIALPPGAALSRFAMKIGGDWQEGEVLERQRARAAYEDFLHRKQDPALLESEAGNEFSARVFPIPARGRKELIVSYSHALTRSDAPYVLPLHGLSQIGRLDVRVLLGEQPVASGPASNLGGQASDRRLVELHKRDWVPDRDLEITQAQVAGKAAGGPVAGLRHDNLALVRVAPAIESSPQEIAGLYVLVDSSASRALGYGTQVARLGELVDGLRNGAGGATPLGVAAFDQEVAPIFEGRADGFGAAERRLLGLRRPLGASDLGRALSWLAERLSREGGIYPRVLLVTDGVATAGRTETRALKEAVRALGERGVERLDVLAVGGLRDESVLRELTTGNLPQDGQRIEGGAPLAEIARRLTLACRSAIQVGVEGAQWVWPETLDGMQPGDEALVYADLPAGRPLRLSLAGRPVALAEPVVAERPLLERAWAQARIERLVHLRDGALGGDDDLRRALGLQIVEVSVRHRVLSPLTALLVLETGADYARFGLDRQALADILTVGPGGLDVVARSRTALPNAPGFERQAAKQAAGPDSPRETRRRLEPSAVLGPMEGSEASVEERDAGRSATVGGVEGGIPGGTFGGLVGGNPSVPRPTPDSPLPPPRRAESVQPVELPGDAPLRVSAETEPVAETITVTAESPLLDSRRISTGASARPSAAEGDQVEKEERVDPYAGRFAEVMRDLAAGRVGPARTRAESWNAEAPGDVLALLALGEAWEAAGEKSAAARAYGSLIDLFPSRADLRRLAGERLERLGEAGLDLAIDTYRKAVQERPDHPAGHRLLAWALLRAGRFQDAFEALEKGLEQRYPGGRFAGVDRVLKEDLGLLGAAWLRADPARRMEVLDRLRARDATLESAASLRFVLTWETDANDVDLHVYDREGGHAYYNEKVLPSGGALFADVTTGYGPECFAMDDPESKHGAPYRLAAHYYSRGPMGYGMGTLQVIAHDGSGRLKVEPRPFVVMADHAMVELGTVGEVKLRGSRGKGK
jgi:tetratricopeptide (TPR) repeat protein